MLFRSASLTGPPSVQWRAKDFPPNDGQLEAVTLKSGERLPFSFLFLFLGAQPCTEWLDDAVARDADGFILTGDAAGADNLLETSVPGIFAAGDVRSGSSKRCAAAVGEGSMAVQFVHGHLAPPASARVGLASSAPTSTRSR